MGLDQRMVEMAAIGYALAFVPEHIWEPLPDSAQARVLNWLDGIDTFEPGPNNWQFFRLLVHLGRERVGAPGDADARQRSLELIESYYLGDGWYQDGSLGNVDYYLPFAFHTYGLIYAASGLGDRSIAEAYVERASAFAPHFQHWFDPLGAAFPFGRSQTYRFAQSSMWGALAMADVEALPWAQTKGLALRHLRWWADRPISDRDGVLSIGYGYDNRRLAEGYNSPGSPYWAMKAFGALAAPADHPFWQAEEQALAPLDHPVPQPRAGLILDRDDTQVVALSGRRSPAFTFLEQTAAKYDKFAYSSMFGFSGDVEFHYGDAVTDSTLILTDGDHRKVRTGIEDAFVENSMLWSRWRPWPDVVVDTVLSGGAPWHHRVHLIRTGRQLFVTETGFAIGIDSLWFGENVDADHGRGHAVINAPSGVSGIRDALGERRGEARPLPPNANIIRPQTAVPAITTTLDPGEHILETVVFASGDAHSRDWGDPPDTPPAVKGLLDRERDRESEPYQPLDIAALLRARADDDPG